MYARTHVCTYARMHACAHARMRASHLARQAEEREEEAQRLVELLERRKVERVHEGFEDHLGVLIRAAYAYAYGHMYMYRQRHMYLGVLIGAAEVVAHAVLG